MIRADATSCPECGSDASTGWKDADEIEADCVSLPETELADEDYAAFLERDEQLQPARDPTARRRGIIGGLLLAILMIYILSKIL